MEEIFIEDVKPECSGVHGNRSCFDATLEEVLHLVTANGLAKAYPNVWGERAGTRVANLMDNARGGRFERTPATYPPNAIFCYNDKTCDYACHVSEFVYWVATTARGAQVDTDHWVPRQGLEDERCTGESGDGCDVCTEWKPGTSAQLDALLPGWRPLFEGDVGMTTLRFFSSDGAVPDGQYAPTGDGNCVDVHGMPGFSLHVSGPAWFVPAIPATQDAGEL